MPEDIASTRRNSRGWKERQAQRDEASFQNTPGGARIAKLEALTTAQALEIQKLEKQIAEHKGTFDNLQGDNGIEVKLPLITFNAKAAGVGKSGETSVNMVTFYVAKGGTWAAYNIHAEETTA